MVVSIFAPQLFRGKVALITGGGTGIGLRTAKEFMQLGGSCILASRKAEVIERAVTLLNSMNHGFASASSSSDATPTPKSRPRCIGHAVNIRDPASIQALIRWIKEQGLECGRVDYLVNNAGGQFPSPASGISSKGWLAVIDTNLNGTFFMTQAICAAFFTSTGGAIVNVVANMHNGFPGMAHTGAARAGVVNLTKSLAVEWSSFGVRVNAIAPGVIASSGLNRYDTSTQEQIKSLTNYANRLGTEAECSAAILFLLSPASAFTTGICLNLDGGESLYAPNVPPVSHHSNQPWEDDEQERTKLAFMTAATSPPITPVPTSSSSPTTIRSKL